MTWDRAKNLLVCATCGKRRHTGSSHTHEQRCVVCDGKFCHPSVVKQTCSPTCHSVLASKCGHATNQHRSACCLCGKTMRSHHNGAHQIKCVECGMRFCAPAYVRGVRAAVLQCQSQRCGAWACG